MARACARSCRLRRLNLAWPEEGGPGAPFAAIQPEPPSLGAPAPFPGARGRRGKPGTRVPTLWSGRGQPHRLFGYWRPGPLACRPPPALAPAPAPPFPQTPRQKKRVLGALAFWKRTQEPRLGWFFLPGASPTLVFVISMESLESRSQPPQHIQTQKDLNWEGISRGVALLAGIWCMEGFCALRSVYPGQENACVPFPFQASPREWG